LVGIWNVRRGCVRGRLYLFLSLLQRLFVQSPRALLLLQLLLGTFQLLGCFLRDTNNAAF
jgi:hypothetical protein